MQRFFSFLFSFLVLQSITSEFGKAWARRSEDFGKDYAKYISPCFLDTGLIYIQLDAVIRSIHFTILQQALRSIGSRLLVVSATAGQPGLPRVPRI